MDMNDAFNAEIYCPNVTDLSAVDKIVTEVKLFTTQEKKRAVDALVASGVDKKLSIGVKKLLMLVEMARQDDDKVEKFVSCLCEEGAGMASLNSRKM
jgi:vesicle-fusing ATPase